MILNFNRNVKIWLVVTAFFYAVSGAAQGDTRTFKAQFALGVNSPSQDGFVSDFQSKSINFPSINLGLQYMFKPKWGAKLDFGYNRFSDSEDSPEFKVNYTRINAQLVYDASALTSFSRRIGMFLHAGPGYSTIKPLGNFGENKTSYLNALTGLELHYGISDKLSLYLDGSYVFGFADNFNPISDGYGSFNGNLLTITIGASISLSGCYYCGD